MANVLPEGLGQLKNSMTSSGIEFMTFQHVAQCLNQLRYCIHIRDNIPELHRK
jgi:hypothetical protein